MAFYELESELAYHIRTPLYQFMLSAGHLSLRALVYFIDYIYFIKNNIVLPTCLGFRITRVLIIIEKIETKYLEQVALSKGEVFQSSIGLGLLCFSYRTQQQLNLFKKSSEDGVLSQ